MGKYDDIIHLPHYRNPNRVPMPIENRAAQFAPFAALSGHDEAIAETSRLTAARVELTDEEKIRISGLIRKAFRRRLPVVATYFCQDKKKEGGGYNTATGVISKIDEVERTITIDGALILRLADIVALHL